MNGGGRSRIKWTRDTRGLNGSARMKAGAELQGEGESRAVKATLISLVIQL